MCQELTLRVAITTVYHLAWWRYRQSADASAGFPTRSSTAYYDSGRISGHRETAREYHHWWRVSHIHLLVRPFLISRRPQSEQKLTTSEQLQLDSEMEGTTFAEERAEEKRQKDERWAQYKDTHPRGAGNTMNRG